MGKEYIQRIVGRSSRPRSERLRKVGSATANASSPLSGQAQSSALIGHDHPNIQDLNKIRIIDGYFYLAETLADDDGSIVHETNKAKAGFADIAQANAYGYTLDWFIPVNENGKTALKLNPIYSGLWTEGFLSSGRGDEAATTRDTPLTSLSDVNINPASLSDGDLIAWNATSHKWGRIAQSSISPDLTKEKIKSTLGISDWALSANPPQTASSVQELTDVTLTSLASNDLLLWNGSKWVNTAKSSFLSGLLKASDLKVLTFAAGQFSAGSYNPTTAGTVNIPTTLDHIADGSTRRLSDYVTTSALNTQAARIDRILSWFDEDANGNIYVVPKNNQNRGFYNNGFISSGEGRSESSGTADVAWGTTSQDAATLIVDGISFSLLKESAHNKIVFLTESEYEGLATKEAGVIYMTYES